MKIDLALQLYSLRNVADRDFAGILKAVAEKDFDGVEFAGFHDYSARELKALLDSLGLRSEGSHTSQSLLEDSLNQVLEDNRILGTKYIILPYAKAESPEEYLRLAEFCSRTGRSVRESGMTFLYHNHHHELHPLENGELGLDILRENTAADELSFQLDVYWAFHAGLDPVEYMEKLGDRCATVHLKDMAPGPEKRMTEAGTGIVDLRSVIAQGVKMGFDWFTLEQDEIYMNEFESIGISCRNIRAMAESI